MKNKNSTTIIILLVGVALGGMLMTGFISKNKNHHTQAFMAASETHSTKTEQIYCTNKTMLPIICSAVEELSTQYGKPIVIEVEPLKNFHVDAYWDEFREGIYVGIATGEPLFVLTDKFESGCGWPSFSKPIDESLIIEKDDRTLGMQRTEVCNKTGNAHLGHVFNDGPKDKDGLRYCISSASLKFIPKAEMEKEGYEKYIVLIKKEI